MTAITEFSVSTVEDNALGWLHDMGWNVAHSPDLVPEHLVPSVPTTSRWFWNGGCGMPWPYLIPISLPQPSGIRETVSSRIDSFQKPFL